MTPRPATRRLHARRPRPATLGRDAIAVGRSTATEQQQLGSIPARRLDAAARRTSIRRRTWPLSPVAPRHYRFLQALVGGSLCGVEQSFFPAMTKIIDTLDPKSRSVDTISACLKAGISVALFDFSWGDAAYHHETLENLKLAIKSTKKLCAGVEGLAAV